MSDHDRPDATRPGPALKGDVLTGDGRVGAYAWEWSNVAGSAASRRSLPWIGIFLLVFGGLLLLRQALPGYATAGSLVVLAFGLALLIKWAIDRRSSRCTPVPWSRRWVCPMSSARRASPRDPGWAPCSLGVAFLAIAGIRAVSGGGVGWQAYLGLLLAIVGGAQVRIPTLGGLVLPAIS